MAVDKTVTVKGDGSGTYLSLNAALVGEAGNLVSLDRRLIIECYNSDGAGGADDNAANITGYTTDSTRYVKITVPAACRHSGVWDAAKYNLLANSGWGGYTLQITENYTELEYLQASYNGGGAGAICIEIATAVVNRTLMTACIAKANDTSNTDGFLIRGKGYLINCLAYGGAIGFNFYDSDDASLAYNCTSTDNDINFQVAYVTNTTLLKNCLANGGITSDYSRTSGTAPTVTYCASEDATADDWGGAGNRISQTFTFSPGTYKITIADAGARDYGTNLSADATYPFSIDVIGTARPQGSAWDIGFFEVVVAAGHPVNLRATDIKGLRQWQPQTGRLLR